MVRLFDGVVGRLGRRGGLIALGCVIGIGVGGGVALATVPDGSGVVHLCYKTDPAGQVDNNSDLRVIDPAATKKDANACKQNEQSLDINQQGPSGATGASGAAGASGAPGASGATGASGPAGPGPLWVNVRSDGARSGGSTGTSSTELRTGVYRVTFPRDVTTCAMSISSAQYLGVGIIGIGEGIDPPNTSHFFFSVFQNLSVANSMLIGERDTAGAFSDGAFSIGMTC